MKNKLRVLTLLINTIPPAQFSLPAIPPAHNASCNSSCRLLAAAFCISGQSLWWEPNLVLTDGSEQISHFHLSPSSAHLIHRCTHICTYTAARTASCTYTASSVPIMFLQQAVATCAKYFGNVTQSKSWRKLSFPQIVGRKFLGHPPEHLHLLGRNLWQSRILQQW